MGNKTALAISVLFHPVFLNAFVFALLLFLFPPLNFLLPSALKWFYWAFVFATTGLIPLLVVGVLKWLGSIKTIFLNEKNERQFPLLFTAVMFMFDFYLFRNAGAPVVITAYLLASATITILLVIINLYYKISLHASSLGALSGVIISSLNYGGPEIRPYLAGALLICGLVMSARLYAGAHTPGQLYSGFLLGALTMIFIL